MKTLLATAALIALAAAASAQEETAMTMDQVPANIMEAATAANTFGTEFASVAMDGTVYEFAGTGSDGMGYEVDVNEDGSIEEVERQIEASALPAPVSAALEQNLAGFQPTMIEESTRPDGTIMYEFEGSHDGGEIDAEINADGTGFTQNADAAG